MISRRNELAEPSESIDDLIPGAIALRAKSRAVLELLVQRVGEVVSKQEIHHQVWGNVVVTDDSISQCIRDIRKLLSKGSKLSLQTLTKRGYLLSKTSNSSEAASTSVKVPRVVVAAFTGPTEVRGVESCREVLDAVVAQLACNRDVSVVDLPTCEDLGSAPDFSPQSEPDRAMYLLHGKLQEIDGQKSLDARLVDARSSECIWSGLYTVDADNPAASRRNTGVLIANAIGTLNGVIANNERVLALRTDAEQRSPYHLYILGKGFVAENYHPSIEPISGVKNLKACLEMDPEFARAWSGLAGKLVFKLPALKFERQQEIKDQMIDAAMRGIRLDPADPHCAVAAALAYYQIGQAERGKQFFDLALRDGKNDADALAAIAVFGTGRYPDADLMLECSLRAIKLNPIPPHWYISASGFAHFHAKQYESSLEALCRSNESMFGTHLYKAMSYAELGQGNLAQESRHLALEIFPAFSARAFVEVTHFDSEARAAVLTSLAKAGLPE